MIFVYYKLFYPRLFLTILSNFNIWLLVVFLLGLLVVINDYRYLFYCWLLMATSDYFINGHYISGYWWLFYWWILVVINGHYISGYWWLFHWWLFYWWLLLVIICYIMIINDYLIINYCRIFYVMIS